MKMYRDSDEQDDKYKSVSTRYVYLRLVRHAALDPVAFTAKGTNRILRAGQVFIVLRKFARRCRVTDSKLRTALAQLKREGDIDYETLPDNSGRPLGTLVTILRQPDTQRFPGGVGDYDAEGNYIGYLIFK